MDLFIEIVDKRDWEYMLSSIVLGLKIGRIMEQLNITYMRKGLWILCSFFWLKRYRTHRRKLSYVQCSFFTSKEYSQNVFDTNKYTTPRCWLEKITTYHIPMDLKIDKFIWKGKCLSWSVLNEEVRHWEDVNVALEILKLTI